MKGTEYSAHHMSFSMLQARTSVVVCTFKWKLHLTHEKESREPPTFFHRPGGSIYDPPRTTRG